MHDEAALSPSNGHALLDELRSKAQALGFAQLGVADVDLTHAEAPLMAWLAAGHHGEMAYMARWGATRARPAELVPGTLRVISVRMNYLPAELPEDWVEAEWARLADSAQAVISLYARGRDYHKVLRQRLQTLATWLAERIEGLGFRVFTDSAPVLEVELAHRSGVGVRGKHTLLLARDGGSMHFLGEIFVDAPLPLTPPQAHESLCGNCTACIDACPTGAIMAPYQVDARRCISYLTIEHAGPIPTDLRPLMGNRLYGCDDCQLACPWNKFAQASEVADFNARAPWQGVAIETLWQWHAEDFDRATLGSPIRRIGFERFQRNLAVVSGNRLRAVDDAALRAALQGARERLPRPAELLEHIDWALAQHPMQALA